MLDKSRLLSPVISKIHIPELDGEVSIRSLSAGEAQEIADRFDDPDGTDAEAAGQAVVYTSLVNDDGSPLLDSPDEVRQLPTPVPQRILNAIGYGEIAQEGN